MVSLTFKGRFELQDPEAFLEDLKKLIEKHKVDYFGQILSENLGDYIDFQECEAVTVNE